MAISLVWLYAFLLGCVCGLRSMTAPAVVAWGVYLGWLVQPSWLGSLANKIYLVVFSLFAIGELIADKLSFIPRRTQAGPLGTRVVFGALCGVQVGLAGAISPIVAALLGAAGGVAGAFAGYTYRTRLAGKVPDLVLALLEDLVAVGGGFFIVSRF